MLKTFNIHAAKTNFSKLLMKVGRGEEVIISKAGIPVAKIVPFAEKPKRRTPGMYKGQITIAPDFDEELPDSYWLGES